MQGKPTHSHSNIRTVIITIRIRMLPIMIIRTSIITGILTSINTSYNTSYNTSINMSINTSIIMGVT